MKVMIFGATGMVGQGVLRECLLDSDVTNVLAIGRSAIGLQHEKFREIQQQNLLALSAQADALQGYDACLFCLGVSVAGMTEMAYHQVTYDIAVSVGMLLAKLNPNMTFIYVSGMGTDSTEQGASMWGRVKGKTENALLRMSFKAAFMFRPAGIQPLHGIKSKTKLYRIFYSLTGPFLPVLKKLFPHYVTTTEQLGRAMLYVSKHGAPKSILETNDINGLPS